MWIMDTVDCRDYVDYGYSGLYIQWITWYNSVAPQNALAFVPCLLIEKKKKICYFLKIVSELGETKKSCFFQ